MWLTHALLQVFKYGLEGMTVVLNNVIATIMENGSSDAERLVDALFTHPVFRYHLTVFFSRKWIIILLDALKKRNFGNNSNYQKLQMFNI